MVLASPSLQKSLTAREEAIINNNVDVENLTEEDEAAITASDEGSKQPISLVQNDHNKVEYWIEHWQKKEKALEQHLHDEDASSQVSTTGGSSNLDGDDLT